MLKRYVFIAVFLTSLTVPASAAEMKPLRLGFLPYIAPSDLLERYTPFADYLGVRLGRPARILIAKNYEEHAWNLRDGKIDIAFLGAAPYVKLCEEDGPKHILARYEMNGQPFFHGVIVTLRDSPLHTLEDLRGRSMAFGDPRSTLSHLVPRAMLLEQKIDIPDLARHGFLGSHDNVIMNVLFGRYEAGAVADEVFSRYTDKPLRVLARSEPISTHVFVAADHVAEAEAAQLEKLIQNLQNSPDGKAVIEAVGAPVTGFVSARDSDYDRIRAVFEQLRGAGVEP